MPKKIHDSCCSPISKLLGNRPTAVESFVSKIDAISFEGVVPSNLQLHQAQQTPPPSSCSPKHSPPFTLIHSSPSQVHNPRLDEFDRDTPTIRQLKTSLRSRLKTDSARTKRVREGSAKSESCSDHRHQTSNDYSLSNRQPSVAMSIKSAPSSSFRTPSAITPTNRFSDIIPGLAPLELPFTSPSISNSSHSQRSLSISSIPTLDAQKKTQSTNNFAISIRQSCDTDNLDSDLKSPSPSTTTPPDKIHSKASTDLPELRIPLINLHISPPKLALWSLEAYDCGPALELSDLVTHLIILPLHTALAITKKIPIIGKCLHSTPLSHQAEKENQGIIITATQIASGLMLASGWKVVKKLINSS